MRVGGSDARWFRMAGIPTVSMGDTSQYGAPDEYADIAELRSCPACTAYAFDMLTRENRASEIENE